MEVTIPEVSLVDVCYYLNLPISKLDARLQQTITEMLDVLQKSAKPRILYRQYRYAHKQLQDCAFPLVGEDIHRLLKTCEQVILLAATLGTQVDIQIKKMQLQDMGKAVVLDACANAGLEATLDVWQAKLRTAKAQDGWYLSERFSPGYGDMPITVQPLFLQELMTQKQIGLHVTPSNILVPGKSVTAILGISREIQPALISGCAVCALKDSCQKRKDGNPCVRT